MRRLLLLGMILSCCSIFAQKVKTVSAEYTFYAPETMSVEEAKRTALDRAKIQAIADEFGTIVSQSTSTVISNRNGETDSQFFAIGGSDVKGEWIETIGEPKFNIEYTANQLVVHCVVKGKAREIASAVINIIAKPLRNGTDLRHASYKYKDGDDLFLYFQSPVDGYISVYLLDEFNQTVYNILPYKSQNTTSAKIIANKEYIFFSKNHVGNNEKREVDEYTLTAESDKEFHTLYILFSPSKIGKQIGFESDDISLPKNVTFKDFQSWLSKSRIRDSYLQLVQCSLTIEK